MKHKPYPRHPFFDLLREFIRDGYSKTLLHPATARQPCSLLLEHGFDFEGQDGDGMYSSSICLRHQRRVLDAEIKIYTRNGLAMGNGLAFAQGLRLDKIAHTLQHDPELGGCRLELLFDATGENGALLINEGIVVQFHAADRAGAGNHYIRTIESDFFFDESTRQKRIATYSARLLHGYSLPQLLRDKTAARRCRKLSVLFGSSASGEQR